MLVVTDRKRGREGGVEEGGREGGRVGKIEGRQTHKITCNQDCRERKRLTSFFLFGGIFCQTPNHPVLSVRNVYPGSFIVRSN